MRIVLDLSTSWSWTRPPVGIVRTERKFAQYLFAHPEIDVAFCRFDKTVKYHVAIERKEAERIVAQIEPESVCDSNSAAEKHLASDEVISKVSDREPDDDSTVFSEDEDGPAPMGMSTTQDAFVGSDPPSEPAARARRSAIRRAFASAGGGIFSLLNKLPETTRRDAAQTFRSGIEFLRGTGRLAAGLVRIPRTSVIDSSTRPANDDPIVNVPPPEPFRFAASDVYLSMGLDWDHNDIVEIYRQRSALGFRAMLFCYDTIPIKFPHLMTFDTLHMFSRYFVEVSHTADRVVAISRTSRTDFLDLLEEVDAPRPPVDVVVLGTDLDAVEATVRPPREDLVDEPFVLCVSTIEARKNHQVLYQAWNRLAARHGDRTPRLVIVGMVGWGVGDLIFRMQMNPLTRNRITILDKLPDGELMWLYRNCLFSVFPSLYEGWGLPVVESLALGKPCICSTAPAVVEAAQGFAIAIDPEDTPAWTAAIEKLWLDENARNAVAARCVRDFHAQTWNDHAKRLLELAMDTTY